MSFISMTVYSRKGNVSLGSGSGGAFQRRGKKYARGFARGVVKAAELLLEKSREIVPIDTQLLHDTSRVKSTGAGFNKEAEVIYNQPYALYQHENLQYKHAPGKSAKYLEIPARLYRSQMADIVRQESQKP